MKNSVLSGVLGPSGRDLAQGEFSFFSFAMVSCAQEVAPTSKMDEAGAQWAMADPLEGVCLWGAVVDVGPDWLPT